MKDDPGTIMLYLLICLGAGMAIMAFVDWWLIDWIKAKLFPKEGKK